MKKTYSDHLVRITYTNYELVMDNRILKTRVCYINISHIVKIFPESNAIYLDDGSGYVLTESSYDELMNEIGIIPNCDGTESEKRLGNW